MSNATHGGSRPTRLPADLIARRGFMVVRRGYDQDEVRSFLDQVATEVRRLQGEVEEMVTAAEAGPVAPEPAQRAPLDEDDVVAMVGEETANVLRAARSAAAELRRRAESESERIVDDARQATSDMRQEAEGLVISSRQDAERTAEAIVAAARTEADGVVAKAKADADALREQAEQERRLTVEGAQAVREKILGDLSRRRRVATVQIEQLRAGRERLLESYAVVRRTLEEVHEELQRADSEARLAADEAARRAEAQPDLDQPSPEPLPDSAVPPTSDDTGAAAGTAPVNGPAGTEAPIVPTPPVDAGVIITGDGFERVRILRPEAPTLRAVPGGRMAAGGAPPVEIVADERPESSTTPAGEPPPPAARPPDAAAQSTNVESTDADTPAGSTPAGTVDALFQRIRAGREASVGEAKQVLEESPAAAGAPPTPPPSAPGKGQGRRRKLASRAPARTAKAAAADAPAPQAAAGAPAPAGPAPGPPVSATTDVVVDEDTDDGLEPRRSDEDEALLQRRDRLVGPVESGLVKKLKRTLQDEQNELLDRLRGTRGAPKAATLLPDAPEHTGRVEAAARPLVEQAVRAGATFAGGDVSAEVGRITVEVSEEMAAGLVTPLRRRLTDAIRDNASDEQSVLVEAIGAVYRECKTQRVEPTVLDAVATAFSRGSFDATPEGTPLRWVVEDTDGPCPDCDDNALAALQPKGETFPTGQVHPPAHAGCRCLLSADGPG